MATPPAAAVSSPAVRDRLAAALELDLVGPGPDDPLAEERLPGRERPSNWYLTGFLVPSGLPPERCADDDEDDDFAEVPEQAGLLEESSEDRKAAKRGWFPSSIGLSFLLPAGARRLAVTVRWGDYAQETVETAKGGTKQVWRRTPRTEEVETPLGSGEKASGGTAGPGPPDAARSAADRPDDGAEPVYDVPGSGGLQLQVVDRALDAAAAGAGLPTGARAVSVFLVNRREPPPEGENPEPAYAFQAGVEVRSDRPFLARPDLRGARGGAGDGWDERVADLHYADTPEYAAGHGVSADWALTNGVCRLVRTAWMPTADVEKTDTFDPPGVELSMEALGALTGAAEVETALGPLAAAYRAWIAERRAEISGRGTAARGAADEPPHSPAPAGAARDPVNEPVSAAALDGTRRETADELLRQADLAADRIERGVAVLAADEAARDAFGMANRAVARALRQRLGVEAPRWRAFQLAFLLLNLPGLVDPRAPDRTVVDLLFFPTGGGKTEAYLGLAAFAMVLRRLRRPGDGGRAGAGISVVMRYTLRLLTLDQLGRAAGLVCALELEREQAPERYGAWPFEIGLWVGKAATPNLLGRKGDGRSDSARGKLNRFQSEPDRRPSPIPLENCPWCGERFRPESFTLEPDADRPRGLRIVCADFACDFSGDRPLPVVAVDEALYRRLPAFLIATVDKFASLPWVGPSGALLGGADRGDPHGFYGPAEPGRGRPLAAPLPPPDLIVQDELHLIAGPLGTMTGLYEAAIETLAARTADGRPLRPKIVASTATVRRAQDQIRALFARPETRVFPPPGPERRDSFFARTAPPATPARRYLGVAATGRNPKVLMRRVLVTLMAAAEREYREAGGHRNHDNPADPYMTVLAYFNSLRELGGARRIIEEEVGSTLKEYGARRRVGETAGRFRDRRTLSEVMELTSRVSTDQVAAARRRLERGFDAPDRVDCAIATNMISVGLDIRRLGLMVVLGQPKAHAEYIQATSRVGRDEARPGLVVTLLNVHKPRDRSHYERFRHYHQTFYRSVEAGSVTPFAARALDRGLAGALVALARHAEPALTPARGAAGIAEARDALEPRLLDAFIDRVRAQPLDTTEIDARLASVHGRIGDLLDAWDRIVEGYRDVGVAVQYQKHEERQPIPLLREMLDTAFESDDHRRFRAARSLRDVEPEVNLFLQDLSDGPGRAGDGR